MTYIKPPAIVQRVFNPIAMKFGLNDANALVVAGRKTGKPQRIPVIPVEYDGSRYIVSTRGESEWVRNVRAAGTVELSSKRGSQRYRATEIPTASRGPIIDAYRKKAGKTVDTYWQSLPDPSDHPTFRLDPV